MADQVVGETAEVKDAVGNGQSQRAQEAGVCIVDVWPGNNAVVYALGRIVAEHGRINAENHKEKSIRVSASTNIRRDNKVVGGNGKRMEPRADPF